jgi:hypothetical protein
MRKTKKTKVRPRPKLIERTRPKAPSEKNPFQMKNPRTEYMQKLLSGPMYAAYIRTDARRIPAASQRFYRPTMDPNFVLRT